MAGSSGRRRSLLFRGREKGQAYKPDIMEKMKTLILARTVDGVLINSGNVFLDALMNNGVLYLDYLGLYEKYGSAGMQAFVKKYVKENGVNCVIGFFGGWEFYFYFLSDKSNWLLLRRRRLLFLLLFLFLILALFLVCHGYLLSKNQRR